MTVIDIIREYLTEHGYGGLCEPYTECGCSLEDLAPCGDPGANCEPGYKHVGMCSACGCAEHDCWEIHTEKPQ